MVSFEGGGGFPHPAAVLVGAVHAALASVVGEVRREDKAWRIEEQLHLL